MNKIIDLIVPFIILLAIAGAIRIVIHLFTDKQSRKTFLLFFIIWLVIAIVFAVMGVLKEDPMVNIIVLAVFAGMLFSIPIMLVIAIIQHFTGKKKAAAPEEKDLPKLGTGGQADEQADEQKNSVPPR